MNIPPEKGKFCYWVAGAHLWFTPVLMVIMRESRYWFLTCDI